MIMVMQQQEKSAADFAYIKYGPYAKYFKRILDFFLALITIVVFSPFILIFIIIGSIIMKGNPFFIQERPGKNDKIFKLIKFRTMTNKKDEFGNLLNDKDRLTKYGEFLRHTSIDELLELVNILKGDMSIIGPRPLLVNYLILYSPYQRHRHDIRPGLTGYAQVHGRNRIPWDEKFDMDIEYVKNITFWGDMKILYMTIIKVFKRDGISSVTSITMEEFKGNVDTVSAGSEQ